MAQATRPSKKAAKIAYKILGKPMNMEDQEPYRLKGTRKKLEFEDWYVN